MAEIEQKKLNVINNKKKKYGNFIEQYWDYEKNGDIDPYKVGINSGPYFLKCDKNISHKWETTMSLFVVTPKCPFCNNTALCSDNSVAAKYPNVVKYWDKERNQGKEPNEVLANDSRYFWWKCEKDHEFIRRLGIMVRSLDKEYLGCVCCRKIATKHSFSSDYLL